MRRSRDNLRQVTRYVVPVKKCHFSINTCELLIICKLLLGILAFSPNLLRYLLSCWIPDHGFLPPLPTKKVGNSTPLRSIQCFTITRYFLGSALHVCQGRPGASDFGTFGAQGWTEMEMENADIIYSGE